MQKPVAIRKAGLFLSTLRNQIQATRTYLHNHAMSEILDEAIPTEDLKVFEQKYYEELKRGGGAVSETTQFQYACCLVRSGYAADVQKGIQLLKVLLNAPAGVSSETAQRRDYLYFLSVGYAKVKDYVESLKNVSQLIQAEPANRQAQELKRIVQKKMEREAYVGMAVTGGAVLAVGGLVGLAMALTRR